MDAETAGQIAAMRAEIASLRAEFAQAAAGGEKRAGGEGADVGLPLIPIGGADYGAFRFEGDKITNCNFYAMHRIIQLNDVTIEEGEADGTWYLNVMHSNLGAAKVEKEEGDNDDDNSSIKLFEIENGQVKKDYRGMPFIPIYA